MDDLEVAVVCPLGAPVQGPMSGLATQSLVQVERLLGYEFRDPILLDRALTHASIATDPAGNYQRLEFLGDRVLGLVVADMLLKIFPDADEGELARRLNMMVRRETCAQVAGELGLGEHIRLAKAEVAAGGRSRNALLGDVCEAVIAALYVDGGLPAARAFIEAQWSERMRNLSGPLRDAKTTLQEWAQARDLAPPTYDVSDRSGPDHDPEFHVTVMVPDHRPARGAGKAKRAAEQDAANRFLVREGIWENSDDR